MSYEETLTLKMLDWLQDCDIIPDDITGITRREILDAVQRHYDGGVKQFVLDGEPS